MFTAISALLFVYLIQANTLTDYLQSTAFCDVGNTVQNKCIKCICTSKLIYDCALQNCTEINIKNNILEGILPKCKPYNIYIQNTTTCVCNNESNWPHKRCSKIFGTLRSDTTKSTCKPDSYVTVDCNVCRCSPNGEIDRIRCTRNICHTNLTNNSNSSLNIYGTCKPKYWYSLGPCQFCYCIDENHLICNKGSYYTHNSGISNHNLSVCKGNLKKEAKELVQDYRNILRDGEPNDEMKSFKKIVPKYINVRRNSDFDADNYDKQEQNYQKINMADEAEEFTESKGNNVKNSREYVFKEYDDRSNENSFESDVKRSRDDLSYDEIRTDVEDFNLQSSESDSIENKEKIKFESSKNLGHKLKRHMKMRIPDIIKKMLKYASRKSLVSIKSDNKCVSGSVEISKCNVCYCLKNGKLLCTENKCQ